MVTINIGRKEAVFFGAIILTFLVAGVANAVWDTSKTMYHSANDVKITIEGVDYSLQEAVNLGKYGLGDYANVLQIESDGIAGATLPLGWQTIPLNTERTDELGLSISGTGAVTIARTGTYYIDASAALNLDKAYSASCRLRIRQTAPVSTTKLIGLGQFQHGSTSDGRSTNIVMTSGRVSLDSGDVIELQRYCPESSNGKAAGAGEDEVYAILDMWQVA